MATTTAYTLDQYKTDGEKALERKKNAAKAQADASFQKLLKYLPHGERAAAAGYSQGLSETARINAENSRLRAYAQAENDYADAHAELLNNYRLEKKAEQDDVYNETVAMIDNQNWNTVDDLQKYLYGEDRNDDGKGGVTEHLSDAQRMQIAQKYSTWANDDTVKEREAAAAANAAKTIALGNGGLSFDKNIGAQGWGAGDNIRLKDNNGTTYNVEIDGEVSDAEMLTKVTAAGVKENAVFVYDGGYYIRYGGKIYRIRQRPSDSSSWEAALEAFASSTAAPSTATPSAAIPAAQTNWITGYTVDENGQVVKSRKHR